MFNTRCLIIFSSCNLKILKINIIHNTIINHRRDYCFANPYIIIKYSQLYFKNVSIANRKQKIYFLEIYVW